MRDTARCFVIGQGERFLKRWWAYRAFIMSNGWGYATIEEITIANQAAMMSRTKGVGHINRMVIDRDSKLRVASVMQNMKDDLLTIRLTVAELGFDVTLFLPKREGDFVLKTAISEAGVETGCVSLTELALILATCKVDVADPRNRSIETAMRVSAMGLGLLRLGMEVEAKVKTTFLFESRVAGALIDSAFKEGDEGATAFANDISRDLIDSQKHFSNVMGLMFGVGLN